MSAFNGVLGVSQAESGYQFAVWAPNAKSVCVTGTFNEWDETANPLESREGGIWVGFADNAKNGDDARSRTRLASCRFPVTPRAVDGTEAWPRMTPPPRR